MSSSISGAGVALLDLLAAAPALSGVQVAFGPPGAYEEQEVVSVLGVEDASEEPAALGNQRKEENYHLEVGIKVYNPAADTQREVWLRAWVLYEALRTVVGANLTLSNTVRTAWVETPSASAVLPAEGGGFVQFIRVLVLCKQRIN